VKLYSAINTDPQLLQNCLPSLAEWSQTWQLSISYKSVFFNIGRSRNNSTSTRLITIVFSPSIYYLCFIRAWYCSTAWNSLLLKNIEELETVQRRFTKRLPLMKHLTYCQQLCITAKKFGTKKSLP